jgi:hypothetical protein
MEVQSVITDNYTPKGKLVDHFRPRACITFRGRNLGSGDFGVVIVGEEHQQ